MARIPRKNLDNTYFHVMVQGINREFIFSDDFFKQKYCQIIKKALAVDPVRVYAYCVMGNHAHILLKGESISAVSMFMRRVNTEYGLWYNVVSGRCGYVFRDRFRCEPILNESYLYKCLAYIHANPLQAGMVDNLDNYRYSSYWELVNEQRDIVDFESLRKIIDISPANIREISHNASTGVFMDLAEEQKVDFDALLISLLKKHNVTNEKYLIYDITTFSSILRELKSKTKVSNQFLADVFKTNRKYISTLLK